MNIYLQIINIYSHENLLYIMNEKHVNFRCMNKKVMYISMKERIYCFPIKALVSASSFNISVEVYICNSSSFFFLNKASSIWNWKKKETMKGKIC